jgi:hypothetical protein
MFGWFERDGKKSALKDRMFLRGIFRTARRRFMEKHGRVPNLLTVCKDEYKDWMSNVGISVKQVDNNLAPRHFTLEFVETLK